MRRVVRDYVAACLDCCFLSRGRVSRIAPGPLPPRSEPILRNARCGKNLLKLSFSEAVVAEHYDGAIAIERDPDSSDGLLDA